MVISLCLLQKKKPPKDLFIIKTIEQNPLLDTLIEIPDHRLQKKKTLLDKLREDHQTKKKAWSKAHMSPKSSL
ncbi:hypothetical protein L1887_03235 [Cichorium endivia]|nr:hypothetical protein L1887_03235 [Cichorium endivia]